MFIFKESKLFQFTLARNWEESEDPTGWLMSEKYDGMRLYWDGTRFITRQHTIINAPEFITKAMPKVPLDGELWQVKAKRNVLILYRTQYGLYQEAVALSQGNISEEKWQKAIFWVFDAPSQAKDPYEVPLFEMCTNVFKGTTCLFVNVRNSFFCKISRKHSL